MTSPFRLTMDQRRAEIDAKRARLEEMRRRREQKEKEKSFIPSTDSKNWESVVKLVASVPKAVRYSKCTQTDTPHVEEAKTTGQAGRDDLAADDSGLSSTNTASTVHNTDSKSSPAAFDGPQTEEGSAGEPGPTKSSDGKQQFTILTHFDPTKVSIFLEDAFKVLERMQTPDPLIKYHEPTQKLETPSTIQQLLQLQGPPQTVTSVDLSPHHANLIACAYSGANSITSAGGSCVLIWSQDFPKSPEYTLKAPTDIIKVKFSKSHPSFVYGAGYNGQIYIWDLRQGRDGILPAIRSVADSTAGHFLPICALLVAPNLNHDVLVSLSVDGAVCMWPSDRLVQPLSRVILTVPGRSQALASTCMCLHHADSSLFLVGTLDGTIYTGRRVDSVGAKAGVSEHPVFRGHLAPVTALEYHPHRDDHVFISASLDWSVRVWTTATKSLEIPCADAVTAVAWSPHHSASFACLCRNTVQVWNLAQGIEEPVAEFEVQDLATAVAWDPYIKGRLVCGSKGETVILSIQESVLEGVWEGWTQ